MDRVDKNKHVYVVEGPLDSLFVDKCIAVAGADGSLTGDSVVVLEAVTLSGLSVTGSLVGALHGGVGVVRPLHLADPRVVPVDVEDL